jgi:hypothetical protein
MKKYRIIELAGYTTKNQATLYFDGRIFESTSFDAKDFDYGDNAEKALEECRSFIKQKEEKEGWAPGAVTCYIGEYKIAEA